MCVLSARSTITCGERARGGLAARALTCKVHRTVCQMTTGMRPANMQTQTIHSTRQTGHQVANAEAAPTLRGLDLAEGAAAASATLHCVARTHRNPVWVLLADAQGLSLALLCAGGFKRVAEFPRTQPTCNARCKVWPGRVRASERTERVLLLEGPCSHHGCGAGVRSRDRRASRRCESDQDGLCTAGSASTGVPRLHQLQGQDTMLTPLPVCHTPQRTG